MPSSLPRRASAASSDRWKEDLTEAQKKRAELQAALQTANDEVNSLRTQARVDGKRIRDLTSENSALAVKFRDRVAEIKGKARLLEVLAALTHLFSLLIEVQDLHDETVALTLQLNVLEDRNRTLDRENKELIERWMARVGQEAEAMNENLS